MNTHKLDILFEDADLIVVNKPAALHSVSQKKSSELSLASLLIEKYPALSKVGKVNEDGGLVQRLDFDTSGLMIAAKNNSSWKTLRNCLMNGEINKYYFCLVSEKPQSAEIKIESYIGSPNRGASKMKIYKSKPAKSCRALLATTIFNLIYENKKGNYSLLKATALTARRHQIRAHAASIGHPLIGDFLYGSKLSLPFEYPGKFFLQASNLEFTHPRSGKDLKFSLDTPPFVGK